jgi:hypothetical protein
MPKSFAKKVRKVVRTGARAVGRVVRKRYIGKGKLKTGQIYRDVMMLKSMINAEKKRIITVIQNQPLGQVRGNDTNGGVFTQDITPVPVQGTTYNTRSGSSIKLHSTFYQFQITQQSANISPISGIIEIYLIKGEPAFPNDMIVERFVPNAFSSPATLIDKAATLNPDTFNKYKLIRRKPFYIPGDQQSSQLYFKTFTLGLKYNRGNGHHIRYDLNTTSIQQGQLIMVIRCDSGNCSTLTASTFTNIPQSAVSTGLLLNYTQTHYYYDN